MYLRYAGKQSEPLDALELGPERLQEHAPRFASARVRDPEEREGERPED
jgi:hypothetical protein